jgi:farnesyl-diphosphate farnesyltransferase
MPEALMEADCVRLQSLLLAASRTFAINIPMMPGVLRDALAIGYLLMRNADTIEDAYQWPKERRIEGLEAFFALMKDPDQERAQEFAARFEDVPGDIDKSHLEVLRNTPYLVSLLQTLPPTYSEAIRSHVMRVVRRMEMWVGFHDELNHLHLERLKELDDYCYSVAGIVGELVTTLISLHRPSLERTRLLFLRTLETGVGAGLQLTNIIKDVFVDHEQGRHYIPSEYLPFGHEGKLERMRPIFAYAYRHLCLGVDYVCALPEGEFAIRKAVLIPLLFAVATLDHLLARVDELFAGSEVKISRETVGSLLDLAEEIAGQNQAIRSSWSVLSGSLLTLTSTG